MITVDNISKSFRGRAAVEGISFEVAPGEIFGLLGHNGAGKSTTFGISLGQLHADAGRVLIDGFDVAAERHHALSRVGAIYEAPAFYDYLSGRRNLDFFVSLSGGAPPKRVAEVIDLVGLTSRIQDPVKAYSHGMRQRLALAQALLPNPSLILLDEPTEGLDPEGIHETRELIRSLRDRLGLTVVLSSHLLHEVEQLCDRVAVLQKGRLVFSGKWQQSEHSVPLWRVESEQDARPVMERFGGVVNPAGLFRLPDAADPVEILSALVAAGIGVRGFTRVVPTLEDFYLGLMKGQ